MTNGKDVPNSKNFCGGNFPDWLEVNLTDKCNGQCAWCIEKDGYHPEYHAPWHAIAAAAISTFKLNIILLGGEPTLYPSIKELVSSLHANGRRVWITTNGSLLTPLFSKETLSGIFGVNISIHHYLMRRNEDITGVRLYDNTLSLAIDTLHKMNAVVRLNCNCIASQIDSVDEIRTYISYAKEIGADKIRFAELKNDDNGFVDLAEILDHKYGLNDNPFKDGCNSDAVIDGMPVNFRQMCGLQTRMRTAPENPQGVAKQVLYYDGKLYDGWQTKEKDVNAQDVIAILKLVKAGKMEVDDAARLIDGQKEDKIDAVIIPNPAPPKITPARGGYCQY